MSGERSETDKMRKIAVGGISRDERTTLEEKKRSMLDGSRNGEMKMLGQQRKSVAETSFVAKMRSARKMSVVDGNYSVRMRLVSTWKLNGWRRSRPKNA